MRTLGARITLLIACACSGTGASSRGDVSRPGAPGGAEATEPEVPSPSPSPTPSQADCEALLAHAAELGARERSSGPPDQHPTDAERQHVTQALAPLLDECRALSIDAFRCAIEAPTLAALEACGAGQATRTSSTSNSSVAPGGITPPAPRSP